MEASTREASIICTRSAIRVSLNRGRHNISLGVDFRAVQFQLRLGLNNNGAMAFDGRYSGSSVADFLLGYALQPRLRLAWDWRTGARSQPISFSPMTSSSTRA